MSSGLKTGIGFRPGTRRSMRWIFFCPAIRPIVLCEHFRISAASAWPGFSIRLIGLPSPSPYMWTYLDNVQIVKIRPHQRFRTQFRGVSDCERSRKGVPP